MNITNQYFSLNRSLTAINYNTDFASLDDISNKIILNQDNTEILGIKQNIGETNNNLKSIESNNLLSLYNQTIIPIDQIPELNLTISNQQTSNQQTSNQQNSNQQTSNQHTSNQSTPNQPTSNQPTSNQPTSNQPTYSNTQKISSNQVTTLNDELTLDNKILLFDNKLSDNQINFKPNNQNIINELKNNISVLTKKIDDLPKYVKFDSNIDVDCSKKIEVVKKVNLGDSYKTKWC